MTDCVVLLAGGKGTRMGATTPKQYLQLDGKPVALHSFEVFASMPEIEKIVVVCDPQFQSLFQSISTNKELCFALPGLRRQDSVFNGIAILSANPLVCIHDAARPFITTDLVRQVFQAAQQGGVAALGVPVKATIKVCDAQRKVISTLDRSQLWEMQTPQVARLHLLKQGFEQARAQHLTVTDDVALVELTGHPVQIVMGSYQNIKLTTPEDWMLATHLIQNTCININ